MEGDNASLLQHALEEDNIADLLRALVPNGDTREQIDQSSGTFTLLHGACEFNAVKCVSYILTNPEVFRVIGTTKKKYRHRICSGGGHHVKRKTESLKNWLFCSCLCHATKGEQFREPSIPMTLENPCAMQITLEEDHNLTNVLAIGTVYEVSAVDDEGQSALHVACRTNAVECVRLLLNSGLFDINVGDLPYGRTALHVACESNAYNCVDLLLKSGQCDVNVVTHFKHRTALHEACRCMSTECLRLILKTGQCDVNVLDSEGRTALHEACKANAYHCVELLLKTGHCYVNVVSNSWQTVLHEACYNNAYQCVKLLLDTNRCDVNVVGNYRGTALHVACKAKAIQCAELLLNTGKCDVNIKSRQGYTALHGACSANVYQAVKLIFETGKCDVNVTNIVRRTPLHTACRARAYNCAEILLQDEKCDMFLDDRDEQNPFMLAIENGVSWLLLFIEALKRKESLEIRRLLSSFCIQEVQNPRRPRGSATVTSYLEYTLLRCDSNSGHLPTGLHRAVAFLLDHSTEQDVARAASKLVDFATNRLMLFPCRTLCNTRESNTCKRHSEEVKQIFRLFAERKCAEQVINAVTMGTSDVELQYRFTYSVFPHLVNSTKDIISLTLREYPCIAKTLNYHNLVHGKSLEPLSMYGCKFFRDGAIPPGLLDDFLEILWEILMHVNVAEQDVLPVFPMVPSEGSFVFTTVIETILAASSQRAFNRIVTEKFSEIVMAEDAQIPVDEKYAKYMWDLHCSRPLRLEQLARMTIFRTLAIPKDVSVQTLPLPDKMKSYVTTLKCN